MPQLDATTFLSQLFWLGGCFLSLYLILRHVALPKVARLLERRESTVEEKLNNASHYRKQAESLLTEYEGALSEARREAQEKYASAAHDLSSDLAHKKKLFLEQKNHLLQAERRKLRRIHEEALEDIPLSTPELAKDILEKLGGGFPSKRKA